MQEVFERRQHVHRIDVYSHERRRRVRYGWWDLYACCLTNLVFMASPHIPHNICLDFGPPKAIAKECKRSVDAAMSQVVVNVDEGLH